MTSNPNEARAAKAELDEPLALNKETLKDLDPPASDAEAVKGGAWPTVDSCVCATDSCIICPKKPR